MADQQTGPIERLSPYPWEGAQRFRDEVRQKVRDLDIGDSFFACRSAINVKKVRGVVAYEHTLNPSRRFKVTKTEGGFRVWRLE